MHSLKAFLTERLTAAAEEIFEAVGKTIVEYNEEISRSKDLEISRLRIQLRLLKSELRSGASLGGQPQAQQRTPDRHDHHHHHHDHHPSPPELHIHPPSFPPAPEAPECERREGDACGAVEQEQRPTPEPLEVKEEEEEEEQQKGHFWIDPDDAGQLESLEPDVGGFMSSPSSLRGSPRRDPSGAAFHDHMEEEHRDKPYCCSVCAKRFSNCSHLAAHIRTHTGERPYRCDICRKAFVTTSGLNRHQTIHTEGKRFICNFCGKTFKWMESLGRHVRSVHKGDNTSD